jgi:predicted DNA-binding transcriptional regulator YafY
MSLHKHALIRYRIIDNLLRNKYKPFPSIDEIRLKCEESLFGSNQEEHICISTIQKDIHSMKFDAELGFFAPIKFSRRHWGYYYEDKEYTIQKIPLKSDDIEALKFAANTLLNFKESEIFSDFGFAIEKIFNRLNIASEVQDERIKSVVKFDNIPDYSGNQHLSTLYNAIVQQQKIVLQYQKFNSKEVSARTIHPYLLKEHRYRWYLIALDESKNEFLTFALDRIVDLKIENQTFTLQSNFNPDNFFKNAFGITQTKDEPCEIVLQFPLTMLGYISTQAIHPSQKISYYPNHFEISIFVIPGFELYEKILSYGNDVKVISPPEIQSKIKSILQKSLEKYQ